MNGAAIGASLLSTALVACAEACPQTAQVSDVDVCVDLATTAAQRLTGLRGRAALSDAEGLLLRFPVEGEVCLVNDGVPFGVDAVLFDEARRVSAVLSLAANDPTPQCAGPARDVLELSAGRARGVAVGSVGVLP